MTYESKKHFGDRRNISREKTTTLNALSRKTYLSTLSSKTCRFMQNAKPLAGTEYEYRDTIDGNAPALPPVPDDSPTPCPRQRLTIDRKSVVEGKRVSVSVDLGGRRSIKKKKSITKHVGQDHM